METQAGLLFAGIAAALFLVNLALWRWGEGSRSVAVMGMLATAVLFLTVVVPLSPSPAARMAGWALFLLLTVAFWWVLTAHVVARFQAWRSGSGPRLR